MNYDILLTFFYQLLHPIPKLECFMLPRPALRTRPEEMSPSPSRSYPHNSLQFNPLPAFLLRRNTPNFFHLSLILFLSNGNPFAILALLK